jgi:signal transduction histidine kinase
MTQRVRSGVCDPALIVAASRARTQAILVAGLLHDLNGPLNNLRLTLELVTRVLAQHPDGDADAVASARLRRYLDTLAQESTRITEWSRAAGAALGPGNATGPEALAVLLEEAQRLFRHHAALSEVRLESAAVSDGDVQVENAVATRALLATLLCAAIALAPAGAVVRIECAARHPHALVRVAIAPAHVPADATGALAQAEDAPRSPLAVDLASLRAQAASLNGEASLRTDARGAVIEVALPRARPPS